MNYRIALAEFAYQICTYLNIMLLAFFTFCAMIGAINTFEDKPLIGASISFTLLYFSYFIGALFIWAAGEEIKKLKNGNTKQTVKN